MGEDFRDHMPCPGTAQEAAERKLTVAEARIKFLEVNIRDLIKTSDLYDGPSIIEDLKAILDHK